jgi:hypothetical protein
MHKRLFKHTCRLFGEMGENPFQAPPIEWLGIHDLTRLGSNYCLRYNTLLREMLCKANCVRRW